MNNTNHERTEYESTNLGNKACFVKEAAINRYALHLVAAPAQ